MNSANCVDLQCQTEFALAPALAPLLAPLVWGMWRNRRVRCTMAMAMPPLPCSSLPWPLPAQASHADHSPHAVTAHAGDAVAAAAAGVVSATAAAVDVAAAAVLARAATAVEVAAVAACGAGGAC